MPLCDTVLRLASKELFQPLWTDTILAEAERNLVADGRSSPESAARRTAAIREHFPEALVEGYEPLIPAMSNDPKDRHVLAAAVRAGADQIVTWNLRDFPPAACEPYDIEVRSPDDFLQNVLDLYPRETMSALREQAAALRRPPMNLDDVIRALARSAPQFAQTADTIVRAGG